MSEHPGKKKFEELVALAEANAKLPSGKWWENVSHADIRSISDAYKAMEAENERLAREALSSDGQAHEAQERALKAEAENERLREFAAWAFREGPFEGCDLAGDAIEEKGVALGLLEATVYDPEKHGPSDCADPGMPWFVFTSILKGSRHV